MASECALGRDGPVIRSHPVIAIHPRVGARQRRALTRSRTIFRSHRDDRGCIRHPRRRDPAPVESHRGLPIGLDGFLHRRVDRIERRRGGLSHQSAGCLLNQLIPAQRQGPPHPVEEVNGVDRPPVHWPTLKQPVFERKVPLVEMIDPRVYPVGVGDEEMPGGRARVDRGQLPFSGAWHAKGAGLAVEREGGGAGQLGQGAGPRTGLELELEQPVPGDHEPQRPGDVGLGGRENVRDAVIVVPDGDWCVEPRNPCGGAPGKFRRGRDRPEPIPRVEQRAEGWQGTGAAGAEPEGRGENGSVGDGGEAGSVGGGRSHP